MLKNLNIRTSLRILRLCHTSTINKIHDEQLGNKVDVKGWVKALRNMKDKIFVDVSDGSCGEHIQIVIPKQLRPNNLTTGASIQAKGAISKSLKGQVEIKADSINVLGQCVVSDGYPFAPKQIYDPDYVRQYPHFRPRTLQFAALLRIRSVLTQVIHDYFRSNNYIAINTPVLTSNDCEGAGEVFSVNVENKDLLASMAKERQSNDEVYFNSKVFLTVSGQLHLEAAAHGLSKVYTLGPTFRAENSKSRLHLSEFYMLEAEIAFLDNLEELLKKVEYLVKTVAQETFDVCQDDLSRFSNVEKISKWISKDFNVLTYKEALSILENNTDKHSGEIKDGLALTKDQEHFLVRYNNDLPLFIINWPKELKPFYMKSVGPNLEQVAAFDLLVPNVGELVGGSLREDVYDLLKDKIPPSKSSSHLEWYLDLRKYGGVATGGYGLGFERFLQFLLQIPNIKDTIPFPRWPHNCAM